MRRLVSQLKSALLGTMRASPEAQDHLEKVTHDTGNIDAMTATGPTTEGERRLTPEEAVRLRGLVSYRTLLWRYVSGVLGGVLLFCIGIYVFQIVLTMNVESALGGLVNTVAWVFIGGGAVLALATFFLTPVPLLLGRRRAQRDLTAGRVITTTGRLAKHARPPQYYWVVGAKSFLIVEERFWQALDDGEIVTVEWVPESKNILWARAGKRVVDFMDM